MFFKSIQKINRLLSKGITNIYLKITIEKNWRTQNFDFRSLSSCLKVSFWGAPTHADIINFSNFLLQLKNQRGLGAKLCMAFLLFLFWKELWRFKVKESMLSVEQKYKL